MLEESHENEIYCPYCKDFVNDKKILDRRCPICHKILQKKCVICGQIFFKKEIGSLRQVCYDEECVQKFRFECGRGNRYWRTPEQISHTQKYHKRGK